MKTPDSDDQNPATDDEMPADAGVPAAPSTTYFLLHSLPWGLDGANSAPETGVAVGAAPAIGPARAHFRKTRPPRGRGPASVGITGKA